MVPYATVLEKIVVCYLATGDSDSTVIDIKKVDRDTSRTILGATRYPVVYGGDTRNCNEYLLDKTVNLEEGDRIRMDLLRVALGNPRSFSVTLWLRRGRSRRLD